MRALLLGCVVGLGFAAIAGADAQAREEGLFPWQVSRNHPWCATYNADGVTECLYDNLAQCRASVSGAGGSCGHNAAYIPPPPPPPRRARTRHPRHS